MANNKTYLVSAELQELCKKLNLPVDGVREELVERLINFDPAKPLKINISRSTQTVCDHPLTPSLPPPPPNQIQTISHLSQTVCDHPLTPPPNKIQKKQSKWGFLNAGFWNALIAIGLVINCMVIAYLFGENQTVEVPVKKSWFGSNK